VCTGRNERHHNRTYVAFEESNRVRCENVCNHGFVLAKIVDAGLSACSRY
jgi:hypothetical protein